MTPRPLLWIPGPTEVRPEVLAECTRPMIGHRSGAMKELTARLDPHLAHAFGLADGSTAQVAVHTTAATGIMEAALRGAGPRVLALVNGAFSKRWAEIAALVGKQVTRLEAPWGEGFAPDRVEDALARQGPFDALTFVASETSTGTRTLPAAIGAVARRHPQTHVLADLVTYLAGAPVDFDASGLDFGFAGTQKALALPPGLSVMCASARYLARAKEQPLRGFYLDPVRIFEGHAARATPATPAIGLYYALARQLEDISAGATLPAADRGQSGRAAWQARFDKHARMQQATEAWAASNGLELLPASADASPTVSCVRAGRLVTADLIAALEERGHKIGDGYGDLKGKTFRIGHMGDHREESLAELLAALDDVV